MIQLIKDKLGTDNILYIQQEKYNGELVNSYVFNYKVDDSYETIELYFNVYWFYSIGGCRSIGKTSLESVLNELKSEFS